jgi:hypothetical protein
VTVPDQFSGELLPRPDPTRLTTDQLRRELLSLREIIETRLAAMDRATELLDATVNRTPTIIQTEIKHVRELIDEKFTSMRGLSDTRLAAIDQQFAERDIRTSQAAQASAQALAAALQAAKEAVFEQAQAAAKAAEKTELSTTKQIDQIQLQIKTISDGFGDRMAELKERIDRGEGSHAGAASNRTEHRLDVGQVLQIIITLIMIVSVLVVVFHK